MGLLPSIDISLIDLLLGRTTYLVDNVSNISGHCKVHSEEQLIVVGTKQRGQSGWLKRQLGLPTLFCARY
jgi:hypothetical protein